VAVALQLRREIEDIAELLVAEIQHRQVVFARQPARAIARRP
jgi:hypothetical protein